VATHYNLAVSRAAIAWAVDTVLARGEDACSPDAVRLLLFEYTTKGTDRARTAVEAALTRGLDLAATESDVYLRLQWLHVLAEAATVSDDDRLTRAVASALPDATDALETRIRAAYEPGSGLTGLDCAAQITGASALLAAFDLSGRLSYPMLAEELMHYARRLWWRDATGCFDADVGVNCAAIPILCRFVVWRRDPDYRVPGSAVGSCYSSDLRRLSAVVAAGWGHRPENAAALGVALRDWFALEPDLY